MVRIPPFWGWLAAGGGGVAGADEGGTGTGGAALCVGLTVTGGAAVWAGGGAGACVVGAGAGAFEGGGVVVCVPHDIIASEVKRTTARII